MPDPEEFEIRPQFDDTLPFYLKPVTLLGVGGLLSGVLGGLPFIPGGIPPLLALGLSLSALFLLTVGFTGMTYRGPR